MKNLITEHIVDTLWNWCRTKKDRNLIKDTTKLYQTKFDCYIESSAVDPLSFTVFEMSDKGELLIEEATRIMESEAAFFLFVNTKAGWMTAIRNTPENQKKLIRQEPIQNIKVRLIK